MNIFFTAFCSMVLIGLLIYLVYQNVTIFSLLEKQKEEIKKLSDELLEFKDDTDIGFGSVEREIESSKNEVILMIQKDQMEHAVIREKNTKKLFKNLSTAFSPSGSQLRDDD